MKSWRIVLEFSTTDDNEYPPESWDWYNFVNLGPNEAISVVSADEIETPEGHVEDLREVVLDELTEIAQKHNMGY